MVLNPILFRSAPGALRFRKEFGACQDSSGSLPSAADAPAKLARNISQMLVCAQKRFSVRRLVRHAFAAQMTLLQLLRSTTNSKRV